MRDVVVIGGPNGAGKTTLAFDLVPKGLGIQEFVNADEIARGLSPFNPEGSAIAAGRAMLRRLDELADASVSFSFETTCATQAHVSRLEKLREAGYRVMLIYLWLASPDAAIARVARRVRQGGHSIPSDVIIRRYWLGLRNMRELYLPLADVALIYDNSDNARVLIAEKTRDAAFVIHDARRWGLIEAATQ
jgi:predicted ABC-type ATPase